MTLSSFSADIGYTALMYAVDKGDTLSVGVLLEAGASVDCKVSEFRMYLCPHDMWSSRIRLDFNMIALLHVVFHSSGEVHCVPMTCGA